MAFRGSPRVGPGQIPRTDQIGHPPDVRLSHLLRQAAAPRLVPLGAELIVTGSRPVVSPLCAGLAGIASVGLRLGVLAGGPFGEDVHEVAGELGAAVVSSVAGGLERAV